VFVWFCADVIPQSNRDEVLQSMSERVEAMGQGNASAATHNHGSMQNGMRQTLRWVNPRAFVQV